MEYMHKKRWGKTEDHLLKKLYPATPKSQILKALSKRTWEAVRKRARELRVKRGNYQRDEFGRFTWGHKIDARSDPRKPKVKLTCVQCGNIFELLPWEAKERKYCSRRCLYLSLRGRKLDLSDEARMKLRIRMRRLVKSLHEKGVHPRKPSGKDTKRYIKRHNHKLSEVLGELSNKYRCIELVGSVPDAIAVDFKQKKVYAIEVGSHSVITLKEKFARFDDVIYVRAVN